MDELFGEIYESVKDQFGRYLSANQGDLREFAKAVAKDLYEAAQNGDEEIIDEIRAQIRARVEASRVGANEYAWAAVQDSVRIVGRVALKALKAAAS